MKRNIAPKDEAARFFHLREECGYDAFKFRVGAECGRNQDEWLGRTEAIIPAIRQALGDNATLLADANSCYEPAQAIAVGRMLEEYGVVHYDEPCPYWRPDWTKQVRKALTLDVTGGEQDNNLTLWRYLIDDHVMDVAQPDICYLGGIGRTLHVATLAQAAGIPITPHSANLSLVTIFTLHLMGALTNAGPYVEFSIEGEDYYPWQYGIYEPMPIARDGKVEIPTAPGWGIRIKDDWLQQAAYQCSEKN
jgi:L-alanine-DL-glutamate epimerase-like enolase superfamily enzyme